MGTHHKFYLGDVREILAKLPEKSVHCCVTSPPYWGLRDYGVSGQLGLEPTPGKHVEVMVSIFHEVWRVLREDGTLWVNYGDCYASSVNGRSASDTKELGRDDRAFRDKPFSTVVDGLKPKNLIGMPWRIAFALQNDGWYLRSDIIWSKPNPMPESITDRPTKAHEYMFLLSKSERYYYDHEAIKEPSAYNGPNNGVGFGHGTDKEIRDRDRIRGSAGVINRPLNSGRRSGNKERKHGENIGAINQHLGRSVPWEGNTRNKRTVWTVPTVAFPEAHFATFPPKLIEPCILAGCPEGGTVLDPFGGSGTTSMVAQKLGRDSIYIDLNPEYLQMALKRCGFTEDRLFDEHTYEVI